MMFVVKVINASGAVTEYQLAEAPSILNAFEDAGYQYPHGCRVGVCGSCISEVVDGIEQLPQRDFIEQRRLEELRHEEQKSGSCALDHTHIRFCCRTALTGDITLRPLSGSVKKMK
ncbi:MAG: (2Fe-2S)-binding protein [Deltaproteobacteria bacterium]|nr:(2Fe-2S)-binding protein [Deltaproteobacteria bacterium]